MLFNSNFQKLVSSSTLVKDVAPKDTDEGSGNSDEDELRSKSADADGDESGCDEGASRYVCP